MKLTKKLEAEILKVYKAYWASYFRGDMKTFASFLDKNITIFGTAVSEVFNTKKDAFRFYKATADQLTGKARFRNRQIWPQVVDNNILINEQSDFYFLLNGKWTFYGHARITAVFKKTRKGWKVVQQHASFPDTKADEGEQVNSDKIKAENVQLRDAVRRRTEELENKNRELEIETALEKVRAVAMGMKQPADMLEICKTISLQLHLSGVEEIRNVQTAIFYKHRETYKNYEFYFKHKKTVITETSYTNHKIHREFAERMLQGKGGFFSTHIDKAELPGWIAYQKTTNVFIDTYLKKASSLTYYWFSLGPVALGISTYKPLKKKEIALFKRFRNVFELAYRRFLDIEQAVAQAKEAKIEAALEKVRSRSLAMHRSDELQDIVNTVFDRMKELEIEMNVASIFVFEDGSKNWQQWVASTTTAYSTFFHIEYVDNRIFRDMENARHSGSGFYTMRYSVEEKNEWFNYAFANTEYSRIPDDRKKFLLDSEFYELSCALSKNTGIQLAKYSGNNFSEEDNEILKRFSLVFEQAYIRFLDLQKAEVQAREAQIELALERVRAGTMAMKKSDELLHVIKVIADQLIQLNFKFDNVSFGINNQADDFSFWLAAVGQPEPIKIRVPYLSNPAPNRVKEAQKNGVKFFADILSKEENRLWVQHLIDHSELKKIPDKIKNYILDSPGYARSTFILNDINFYIGNYKAIPYTEQENNTFNRFAQVFEQSYTRFLDLQKAEAQAKEAQVETALERVRSRSMGMQKSEELKEVIQVVYEQFVQLNINTDHTGFVVDYKSKGDWHFWIADKNEVPSKITHPYFESVWANQFNEAKENGTTLFTTHLNFEEKNKFYHELLTYIPGLPDESKQFYLNCPGLAASTALSDNVSLYIENFSGIPYSNEENAILKRFAKVFEQTYTRFLDLKKAEAQAREAKIEAALEKVRSRSLAMHHSSELEEVVRSLFDRLLELGLSFDGALIFTFDKQKHEINLWIATNHLSAPSLILLPYDEEFEHNQILNDLWSLIEKGEYTFSKSYSGKPKNEYFRYTVKHNESKIPESIRLIQQQATSWSLHCCSEKHSIVGFDSWSGHVSKDADIQILKRFSKVFDQAYVRFLDLQKAEEQARESQIQLALERVRARTMAMHKSDELRQVVALLFEQIRSLGFDAFMCSITLLDKATGGYREIVSSNTQDVLPHIYNVPYFKDAFLDRFIASFDEGVAYKVFELGGIEKRELDNKYFTITDFRFVPEESKQMMLNTEHCWLCCAYMKHGCVTAIGDLELSANEAMILQRFAKVFEQTYTRFLDLQKAEAQARESKIEACLEKVRARTMGMQHSNELAEAASLLFQQVKALGIESYASGFNIWDNEHENLVSWMSNPTGSINPPFEMPIHTYEQHERVYNVWKNDESFLVDDLTDEALFKHYQFLRSFPLLDAAFKRSEEAGIKTPDRQVHNNAFFKHGYLLFITLEPCPQFHDIFERFAKVFDQTYTRFLDLQKAEAQTRESKIQLALERARAQSMIMQHSTELDDTLRVFHEQVLQLNIPSAFSFLWLPDEDKDRHVFWAAWAENNLFKSKAINYPLDKNEPATAQCLIDWKSDEPVVSYHVPPDGVKNYFAAWSELITGVEQLKPEYFSDGLYYVEAFMKYGCFGVMVKHQLHEDEKKILERFAIEFERAYTRFLDLQKAEAQARESQIQLALERVRARTMAMQGSEELAEVSFLLNKQVVELGILTRGCAFNIYGENESTEWFSNLEGTLPTYKTPREKIFLKYYEAGQRGETLLIEEFDKKRIKQHYDYLHSLHLLGHDDEVVEKIRNAMPDSQVDHVAYFKYGYLLFITLAPATESHDIFKRFAKEFEQTYTRFLDLQKAEVQAREAKIEAALERVRSIAMSMMNSEDLLKVCESFYIQLEQLGFKNLRCTQVYVLEDLKQRILNYEYLEGVGARVVEVKYGIHKIVDEFISNIKSSGEQLVHALLSGNELLNWKSFLVNVLHQEQEPGMDGANELHYYHYSIGNGALSISAFQALEDEQVNILKRLRNVFSLSYKRYVDIVLAETQAREAQIELSLERVRAKTMAMHNSNDVGETAAVMVEELKKLGIETIRCGIGIMHEPGDMEVWTINTNENKKTEIIIGWLDMKMHPLLRGAFESWRNKKELYSYELKGDDLFNYYNAINNYPGYPIRYNTSALPPLIHHNEFHFTEGTLFAFSLQQLADEQRKIFKRFAGVFGQTYRRYLDLKKAEAQARQAKIEAAMEKVRAKAMAMQKPAELVEVAQLLRTEMGLLGVEELETSSIYIHDEATQQTECWYAIQQEEKMVSDQMHIHLPNTWVGREMLAFYHSDKKQTSIVMQGEARKEWINYCAAHSDVLVNFYGDVIPDRTYHLYKFSNGYMGAASPGNISAESWDLLQRATTVFSLAYTRFSDLQLAEAQAREAQIEAALERVRSRTLAMQKSDELAETAAVLFKQLIGLGIEPNRLYIGILNDESGNIEFWITDEDGSRVSNKFLGNANRNKSMKKMYDGWALQKKSIIINMEGQELSDYFHYLGEELHVPFKGGLSQKRRVQNIAYFSKGFIGIASPDDQPEETTILLERFAGVFNLTFTRFNDLKIAEAHALQAEEDLIKLQTEKKRAEDALTELQATQKQLIQSEKMASLGQLTAGIAHEIQNPLNFVNNFSEVSNELIQELKSEKSKVKSERDEQLEDELLNDIQKNLEKINHHGKRADGIVKGMLQHSRTSSSVKEPTDINVLADEYLRLSYHGLRGKDNSFNAAMQTDFDESIGKVNIISQDISRVLLNLFNNAFYAVNEKKKMNIPGYEPAISVSTKKEEGKIFIMVKDNGDGIPQNILDKIFQPFFTTKPTGQGTGLGLSLSYDIIKAHGGEIRVETEEGGGCEFIILIPS